jgi:antibiotic biosynthesis monooxygenase (ABM) superfamily enzyme
MNAILMVHYKIGTNDLDVFEIWKEKMDSVISSFNGYLSTTVLYPINNNDHYIILRFDSRETAQQWMQSDFRRIMLEDSDTTWMTEK